MEKIKYEIDPHNRLVIVKKYRLCLDGYFKTDKGNQLQYHIKSPYRYRAHDNLPYRINLKGRWSLTRNHDFLLTLRRSYKQRSPDTLLLKGNIIFVKENSLGFSVTTRNLHGKTATRTLVLNGRWQMDNNNRIAFLAKRERGIYDTLTFRGGWEVNRNNEIEYSYKKTVMKRKTKYEKTLTFKGRWEVIDNHRINYALDLKGASGFELKASLVRTGFLGNKNALIYKLGTRISSSKNITIYGKWKLTRHLGLLFEVKYSHGRRSYLKYGAEVRLNKRSELVFLLRDRKNKPLGIEVVLKRKFLGGSGEALFKLLSSGKEKSIILSVGKLF